MRCGVPGRVWCFPSCSHCGLRFSFIIIVTTNDIAGYRIAAIYAIYAIYAIDAIYGEVMDLTVRSRDIGASFTATLRSAPLAL